MHLYRETFLLFSLNMLDAFLTLIWVRGGVTNEANWIMASLLDINDLAFVFAKLAMGSFTAIVLLRFGDRPLARYGVTVALALYIGVMGVHLFTGLAAFGYLSKNSLPFIEEFLLPILV
jgi:hypothetical protein